MSTAHRVCVCVCMDVCVVYICTHVYIHTHIFSAKKGESCRGKITHKIYSETQPRLSHTRFKIHHEKYELRVTSRCNIKNSAFTGFIRFSVAIRLSLLLFTEEDEKNVKKINNFGNDCVRNCSKASQCCTQCIERTR